MDRKGRFMTGAPAVFIWGASSSGEPVLRWYRIHNEGPDRLLVTGAVSFGGPLAVGRSVDFAVLSNANVSVESAGTDERPDKKVLVSGWFEAL